jgi:hypothetical protein
VYEVTVHAPVESAADLNRLAALAGITLRGLRTYRPSLEETFLEATGTTDGDIDPALELNRAGGSVTDQIARAVTRSSAGSTRSSAGSAGSSARSTGSSADPGSASAANAIPAVPAAAVPDAGPAVPHSTVLGHREPDDVPAGAPLPRSTS